MTREQQSAEQAYTGPGWFWTQAEWADWSDDLARLVPEEYEDDVAQESIIERAMGDMARRLGLAEQGLADAAAWIAESIGYPVECSMPDHPMPEALWQALVDHVYADVSGRWHGNTLDREDTESWLTDEAGCTIPPAGRTPEGGS